MGKRVNINQFISAPTVRLIGPEGEQAGIVSIREALEAANEAGLDLGLSDDRYESYRIFQGRILREYDRMIDEFSLSPIDAPQSIVAQQQIVRQIVRPHLEGVLRAQPNPWRDVLAAEKLSGRYLDRLLREYEEGSP